MIRPGRTGSISLHFRQYTVARDPDAVRPRRISRVPRDTTKLARAITGSHMIWLRVRLHHQD